jgi:hypothetical protein
MSVIKCDRFRIALTKLRCSDHKLDIKIDRHRSIPSSERLCKRRKMKVMEDEYHFMLVCPVLRDIPILCLKPFYNRWPTFISLMSDMSNNTIFRLSKYVYKAFEFRKNVYVNS